MDLARSNTVAQHNERRLVECIPGFQELGALSEPIVHLYSASLMWMGNQLGLAIGAHGAGAVNFPLMLAIVLEEFGFRICPPTCREKTPNELTEEVAVDQRGVK
jgi:hypothetical protein